MSKYSSEISSAQPGCVRSRRGRRNSGFTLVELLVVVTIIGILVGLSTIAVAKALEVAGGVKEAGAARSLITAYMAAASDNNGFLIPGYDRTAPEIELPDGTKVSGPTAQRYPYRLAPYFNFDVKSTLLVSDNVTKVDPTDHYRISAFPSFGINYIFVGGDVSTSGDVTFPAECLQVSGRGKGAPVLVFATAAGAGENPGGGGGDSAKIEGYCMLQPPNLASPIWKTAPWTKDSHPADYGQVDPRHGNKAVCAFSDGAVRNLTMDELRDMRLWSYRAANSDNKNYTIASSSSGGGRR